MAKADKDRRGEPFLTEEQVAQIDEVKRQAGFREPTPEERKQALEDLQERDRRYQEHWPEGRRTIQFPTEHYWDEELVSVFILGKELSDLEVGEEVIVQYLEKRPWQDRYEEGWTVSGMVMAVEQGGFEDMLALHSGLFPLDEGAGTMPRDRKNAIVRQLEKCHGPIKPGEHCVVAYVWIMDDSDYLTRFAKWHGMMREETEEDVP